MNPRYSSARVRSVLTALILTAVSIIITLVIGEVTMRVLYKEIGTTSDYQSYFSQRWRKAHRSEINDLGYRERPFTDRAAPGTVRIVVLGDSFTFGQGIELQDRLSNRLEIELNRRQPNDGGRRFEVLNFGKPGAETEDHVRSLPEILRRTRPDFVLLQWFVNDVEGRVKERPQPWRLIPSTRVDFFLKRHSALYFVLNRGWLALQMQRGWHEGYVNYMLRRYADPQSSASMEASRAFKDLLMIPGAAGVELGVFLFPELEVPREDPQEFEHGFLIDRTLQECRESGLQCVDLRPSLRPVTPRAKLWVNQFDHHPSKEANRIATDAVLQAFSGRWQALAQSSSNLLE